MKRHFLFVICWIVLLLTSSTSLAIGGLYADGGLYAESGTQEGAYEKGTPSPYATVNTVKGLTLTPTKKKYSPFALTLELRINNNTRLDYGYGVDFALERKSGSDWVTLPNRVEFPMMEFIVFSGKRAKVTLTLTDELGRFGTEKLALSPGQYRVVKKFYADGSRELCCLAAEFTITPQPILYATEPVYFRTGPGTEYAIIRELALGEAVVPLGKSGKWGLVLAGGKTGYVFAKYLTASDVEPYWNDPLVTLPGKKNIAELRLVRYTGAEQAWFGQANAAGAPVQGRSAAITADFSVQAELKKPFSVYSYAVYYYADEAAAKTQFETIRAMSTAAPPDAPHFRYCLWGSKITVLRDGGLFDETEKHSVFFNALSSKLSACDTVLYRP